MYPNLYYVLNDWFGWKINMFKIFYTFGIFVAISFIISAYFLTIELKRKEKKLERKNYSLEIMETLSSFISFG